MLKSKLKEIIRTKLNEKFADLPDFALATPPRGMPGDFSVNIPLVYAKRKKSPLSDVSAEISAEMEQIDEITEVFSVGGFINFCVSDDFVFRNIAAVYSGGENLYEIPSEKGKKILIEFVSSNPTGPLHIGHARCAAIGDSLARLHAAFGFSVEKEYYVNDLGNQVEILKKSVEARLNELKNIPSQFPENGYKGAYIYDIAREFIKRGETDIKKFAVDYIMEGTKRDLEDFRVVMDKYFKESSLKESTNQLMKELSDKSLSYEFDGAIWFGDRSQTEDEKDRVLRKRTGDYTYFATDIAYHRDKFARGYDELLNIWGADHHGYVNRIKTAVRSLGYDVEKLKIILYQLVSLKRAGKKIAMSTRAGEFVTLKEVVDEVGTDASRFFLLMRAPDSPVEFDLELAKKQTSENPVYYVQYAHARISSVFAEAKKRGVELKGEINWKALTDPAEKDLAKLIASFGDVLLLCRKDLSTHHITTFLIDLAKKLHNFYERCRVISDDAVLTNSRLALIKAAQKTIKFGLNILGVSAPERM